MPHTTVQSHQDMLARITREITATEDLQAVLSSVATALASQPDMIFSRVWLYLSDDRCDWCRAHGRPANALVAPGVPGLHLCASAGVVTALDRPHHLVPLTASSAPAIAAFTRRPIRTDDILADASFGTAPAQMEMLRPLGAVGAASYPLLFRGELLGSMGMVARRPLDDEEFQLMGIFADQAAMAIKSAHLFRELQRYRDRLEVENAYLREQIHEERGWEGIIGESPALRTVLRRVQQVAPVETTVLLTGETGTGKELIARAIHEGSPRKGRPLIKVNCGAIPQGVVESELFGHEKGAFTGALQRRIGRFELAHTSSLFMDEVGELPLDTQVKLLRVLQEQEFERVGSTRPMKVDVRVVAATNRDLEVEVSEGRFRPDLFYRLNVFPIRVPPLRERPADIPMLVQHFLAQFQRKLAKPLRRVTTDSLARLQAYPWPGNIRELQNVIERACVLADGPVVEIDGVLLPVDRSPAARGNANASVADGPIIHLSENEANHIRRALLATNGKVHGPGGAADLLGINANTLRSRMRKLGIGKHPGA
jgi:formate hydrogenlyase transcriptional activator